MIDVVPGCPFCRIVRRRLTDTAKAMTCDWGDVVAFAPLHPVAPGHLLVVPVRHVVDALVAPDVTAAVFRRAAEVAIRPCNLITSAGEAATQTVPHLHVHVVPRRPGDTLALPWAPAPPPRLRERPAQMSWARPNVR